MSEYGKDAPLGTNTSYQKRLGQKARSMRG